MINDPFCSFGTAQSATGMMACLYFVVSDY